MKIGIILIFHNNEKDINNGLFTNLLNQTEHIPLCFVNNGSKDSTLESLKLLKAERESNITIIDIKRNKGDEAAVKAGARYLFNKNDLKHVGFINMNASNSFEDFEKFFKTFTENKKLIIEYNIKRSENSKSQRAWFKDIFSITNFIDFEIALILDSRIS
jgi:GT2 family glycosyltransferase